MGAKKVRKLVGWLVAAMADSDIQVGSLVRYVGFNRNVRDGSEGVVTKFLPPDRFWVSFGRFTMDYARGELDLVRPPKPSEIRAADFEQAVQDVLASSPKVPYTDAGVAIIENAIRAELQRARTDVEYGSEVVEKICSTMLRAASPVNTVWAGSWTGAAESGPGIAALNLQAPPRPRRRHQTTSWDPDMPLPDAEPGRYGWLP